MSKEVLILGIKKLFCKVSKVNVSDFVRIKESSVL